jgi:hypothetical protein
MKHDSRSSFTLLTIRRMHHFMLCLATLQNTVECTTLDGMI